MTTVLEAIQSHHMLYVQYARGTRKGQLRPIGVLAIYYERNQYGFIVYDFEVNEIRTYSVVSAITFISHRPMSGYNYNLCNEAFVKYLTNGIRNRRNTIWTILQKNPIRADSLLQMQFQVDCHGVEK